MRVIGDEGEIWTDTYRHYPAYVAARRAYSPHHFTNLLPTADRQWVAATNHQWFGQSYHTRLPSQWALQTIGLNFTVALSNHLLKAIGRCRFSRSSRRVPHPPRTLYCRRLPSLATALSTIPIDSRAAGFRHLDTPTRASPDTLSQTSHARPRTPTPAPPHASPDQTGYHVGSVE